MRLTAVLAAVILLSVLAVPLVPAQRAAGFDPKPHLAPLGRQMMEAPASVPDLGRALASDAHAQAGSAAGLLALSLRDVQGRPAEVPALAPGSLVDEIARADLLAGRPLGASERAALAAQVARLDPRVAAALADLVAGANAAQSLRGDPWRALTPEDLRVLAAHASVGKPFVPGQAETLLGAAEPTDLEAVEGALAHVDADALMRADLAQAQGLDLALAALKGYAPAPQAAVQAAPPGDVAVIGTPYGPIYVSGTGSNAHDEAAFVSLDLGGDDTWTGSAGAVRADVLNATAAGLPPQPDDPGFPAWAQATMDNLHRAANASLVLDLSGNDLYQSSAAGAQGYGGWGGFGAVVDVMGDDTYDATAFAQGAGQVAGVGILLDLAGNDRYTALQQAQGFGQDGGGGILSDATGQDVYEAQVYAQGTGYGADLVGLLVDGAGDDAYRCEGVTDSSDSILPVNAPRPGSICHAAGFGGTGLLLDGQGDDLYFTASSFQAMTLIGTGLLVDSGGQDQFLAGEWSNAVGVLGAAAIVEGSGDTLYRSGETVGPWADVYVGSNGEGYEGVAALADAAGNDRYVSQAMHGLWIPQYACGAGCSYTGGSGLLLDGAGDDQYVSEVGQGGAQMGAAALVDLGGDDQYQLVPSLDDARWRGQGYVDDSPVILVVVPDPAYCHYAVLEDLGGTDAYDNPVTDWGARGDDQAWGQNDFGRGLDGTQGNLAYVQGPHFQADLDKILDTDACEGVAPPAQTLACQLLGRPEPGVLC